MKAETLYIVDIMAEPFNFNPPEVSTISLNASFEDPLALTPPKGISLNIL